MNNNNCNHPNTIETSDSASTCTDCGLVLETMNVCSSLSSNINFFDKEGNASAESARCFETKPLQHHLLPQKLQEPRLYTNSSKLNKISIYLTRNANNLTTAERATVSRFYSIQNICNAMGYENNHIRNKAFEFCEEYLETIRKNENVTQRKNQRLNKNYISIASVFLALQSVGNKISVRTFAKQLHISPKEITKTLNNYKDVIETRKKMDNQNNFLNRFIEKLDLDPEIKKSISQSYDDINNKPWKTNVKACYAIHQILKQKNLNDKITQLFTLPGACDEKTIIQHILQVKETPQ